MKSAYPTAFRIIVFTLGMAVIGYGVKQIILGYGHIGFIALMVVGFAIAFIWEWKSPTPQADDHRTLLLRRLGRTDITVSLITIAALFGGLLVLPRSWFWF